jgi:hypothetical protein
MLRTLTALVAALVLSSTLAFAGDPAGRYSVVGTNPGNKARYSGTVRVERTGQTFRVTWDIGTQTFVGTGIGSDKGWPCRTAPAAGPGWRFTTPMATIGRESEPTPAARTSGAKPGLVSETASAQVS